MPLYDYLCHKTSGFFLRKSNDGVDNIGKHKRTNIVLEPGPGRRWIFISGEQTIAVSGGKRAEKVSL